MKQRKTQTDKWQDKQEFPVMKTEHRVAFQENNTLEIVLYLVGQENVL